MTQQKTDPLRQIAHRDFLRHMGRVIQTTDLENADPWPHQMGTFSKIDLNDIVVLTTVLDTPPEPIPLPNTHVFISHDVLTEYTPAEPQHSMSPFFRPEEWVGRFFRSHPNPLDIRETHRRKLFTSDSDEDVLDILDQNNLNRYIDDYLSYSEYRLNNLEDDERPGIILHSLQSWAWFLIDCAKPLSLPYTRVSADFHGCVELEWELSGNTRNDERANKYWGPQEGIAMLRFLSVTHARFLHPVRIICKRETPHNLRIMPSIWRTQKNPATVCGEFSE